MRKIVDQRSKIKNRKLLLTLAAISFFLGNSVGWAQDQAGAKAASAEILFLDRITGWTGGSVHDSDPVDHSAYGKISVCFFERVLTRGRQDRRQGVDEGELRRPRHSTCYRQTNPNTYLR